MTAQAWIGGVQASRSGQTIYFNGKAFKRRGGAPAGNYYDVETGDVYWISGVKRNGRDRHWAGSGKITIEAAVVDEYLEIVGRKQLDSSRFVVSHAIRRTNPARFHDLENERLGE